MKNVSYGDGHAESPMILGRSYGYCSFNEVLEHVGIVAIIVLVAGFDNISRGVRLAVVMVLPENSTFDEAPKPLNGVRVYHAFHIRNGVIDSKVWNPLIHTAVAPEFVRYEHAIISLDYTTDVTQSMTR